jgi:hypothetical protein
MIQNHPNIEYLSDTGLSRITTALFHLSCCSIGTGIVMFSSFGKSTAGAKSSGKAPTKAEQEMAQVENDRAEARRIIDEHHARIKPNMEKMHSVANSQYWRYGYMGGTLITSGALTFAISSRFPAFASVGSMASLGLAFIGGPKLHDTHVLALRTKTAVELDKAITAMETGDTLHGPRIPLYYEELQSLRKTRAEVLPMSMSSEAGAHHAQQAAPDLDGRVDNFLAAYERRRGALPADNTSK